MSAGQPTVALVAHGVHDRGGMERAFAELIRRAHDRVRFVVVSAELDRDLRPLVEWHQIRVPMRPIPLKILAFAAVAGLRLARVRADLVHTLGAIVPNRVDVITVQYCHAGDFAATRTLAPAGPPLRRLNSALKRLVALAAERWCYRPSRVHTLAAVSRGVARELKQHYPGVPVEITPNGVKTDRFRPDAGGRAAARAEIGVASGDLALLFLGGDWDRKGLATAISALALVHERGFGDTRLIVVGAGDARRFGTLAAERGVAESVRFLGPRADTERWYQAADVFVAPTLYETFSLAAHEAAATGVPVVATRVSGIDELIGDDESGILVERDATAVADAIVVLATDEELRRRLGHVGRRRTAAFGWERSVASVMAIYGRLV